MYQVAVIGGGPGGYVAAIRAAQLGAKVCVIEKDELGGTCLNRGCIPTKALVGSVSTLSRVKHAADFGIEVQGVKVNFAQMMERKNRVVDQLVQGIHFLFKKNKIDLISGSARIVKPGLIAVTVADGSAQEVTAENIIVATGSEPALIQALGYNGTTVITSNEALRLEQVPASLLVIGGGVIGCEFACIFAELGTQVTIVDVMPTILPMVDKEAARQMQGLLKRRGITIKTKAGISKVETGADGVTATLDSGETITASQVLISIGRTLNTSGLGLEENGVNLGPKGEIIVDDRLRTNVPGIYAIGDVTNKIQLAHVASAQGQVAAENIMGIDTVMDYTVVPSCIFTAPEVASVGLSTQQAEAEGRAVKTGKFNFLASGKALAMGEAEGFVKMIADAETDQILGVHIVGPHATDLIAEASLAIKMGATAAQVAKTIHAHPTLAETMMEAAEAVHGLCIHG